MLEVIKYGSNKYGVWVIGHLKYDGFEFVDIFNTNLKDEEYFKDKTNVKPKLFRISRNKNKQLVCYLEF